MHFWIDKRSQQCGFARPRVAASLSGTGTGARLGFGHPSRRFGGIKPTAKMPIKKYLPSVHTYQQQHQLHQHKPQQQHKHQYQHQQQPHKAHQHEQQQQQQQEQQLQQQQQQCSLRQQHMQQHHYYQYPLQHRLHHRQQQHKLSHHYHSQNASNTPPTTITAANNHASRNQQHMGNKNNSQMNGNNIDSSNCSTNTRSVYVGALQYIINNNASQPLQPNTCGSLSTSSMNTNTTNNSYTNATTAVGLTDSSLEITVTPSFTCEPKAGHNFPEAIVSHSTRAASISGSHKKTLSANNASNKMFVSASKYCETSASAAACRSYPKYQYDMRSYYHPQFGNLAVRCYQHISNDDCGSSDNVAYATNTLPHAMHIERVNAADTMQPVNIAGSTGNDFLTKTIAYRNEELESASMLVSSSVAGDISDSSESNMTQPLIAQQSGDCITYRIGSVNSLRSNCAAGSSEILNTSDTINANDFNSTDVTSDTNVSQKRPTYLKFGMCAFLVLASVILAGAKFYLDHQGTAMGILILGAFSVTLFITVCTVSLCRIPKELLSARSNDILDDNGRTICTTMVRNVMGWTSAIDGDVSSIIYDQPNQRHMYEAQERYADAQAGPPPYHIAILLPEHTKETQFDESPPPSYDKILI